MAITRARKHVAITFAASRRVYNQWRTSIPSRFIDEIPAEHVEITSDRGVYPWPRRPHLRAPRPRRRVAGCGGRARPGRRRRAPARRECRQGVRHFLAGLVIEGRAERVKPSEGGPTVGGLVVGDRIFHQKFGYGRVAAVDGNRLQIDFEKAGTKKVIDTFVAKA